MGMELSYQGIPPDSGFVELVGQLALRDLSEAQRAQFVPSWMRWGHAGREPAPGREGDIDAPCAIWTWCCQAVGRYPGIRDRNFYVGKAVHRWRFMFNAAYRKQVRRPRPHPTDERTWNDPESELDALMDVVFLKAPQIAPNVVATQGHPIEYIAPAQAVDIGLCVGATEVAEIIPHLDELIARNDIPHWDREFFVEQIAGFQRFWRATAEAGDGVLVTYD